MADAFDQELDRILADAQLQGDARLEALDLPSWYTSPDDYEQVSVNGQEFFCAPIPLTKETRFDPKKARGRDGANVTHTGVLPVQGEIVLRIWTGTDERRWRALAPQVDPQRVITTKKTVKVQPAAAAPGAAPATGAAPTTKVVTTKTMPLVRIDSPLLGRGGVDQVYLTKIAERLDVEQGMLLVTLHYVKSSPGGEATAKPKKQTDIVLPNAFDKTGDIRQTKPDPAKETKL